MIFDPTPQLRWVQRNVYVETIKGRTFDRYERVLQVGYLPINGGEIQWRDIPTVHLGDIDESQ